MSNRLSRYLLEYLQSCTLVFFVKYIKTNIQISASWVRANVTYLVQVGTYQKSFKKKKFDTFRLCYSLITKLLSVHLDPRTFVRLNSKTYVHQKWQCQIVYLICSCFNKRHNDTCQYTS